MKDYLEQSLKILVDITEYNIGNSLPLMYKGLYHLYSAKVNGIEWILAEPKEKIGLAYMRKNQRQIEKLTGLNCALYLNGISSYTKDIMVNEGIPFVIEGKQIFLPFLGILLTNEGDRVLTPVKKISFLAQKLILTAIYEKWKGMTVTRAAENLCVTKMSVTRCFDEIEYLEIPILTMNGKSRAVSMPENIKGLWEEIKPILRNPVIATFDLIEDMRLKNKAGISALCEYSMLEDNAYPTYAITKKEMQGLQINKMQFVPKGEEIGCVIQELGYYINYRNKNVVDPLSVLLSLSEGEQSEDRISISINEMLKEYVW